jgi:hypothetical protein
MPPPAGGIALPNNREEYATTTDPAGASVIAASSIRSQAEITFKHLVHEQGIDWTSILVTPEQGGADIHTEHKVQALFAYGERECRRVLGRSQLS